MSHFDKWENIIYECNPFEMPNNKMRQKCVESNSIYTLNYFTQFVSQFKYLLDLGVQSLYDKKNDSHLKFNYSWHYHYLDHSFKYFLS